MTGAAAQRIECVQGALQAWIGVFDCTKDIQLIWFQELRRMPWQLQVQLGLTLLIESHCVCKQSASRSLKNRSQYAKGDQLTCFAMDTPFPSRIRA
eukprot:57004-Pelagomonas_calceolata.AAC.2